MRRRRPAVRRGRSRGLAARIGVPRAPRTRRRCPPRRWRPWKAPAVAQAQPRERAPAWPWTPSARSGPRSRAVRPLTRACPGLVRPHRPGAQVQTVVEVPASSWGRVSPSGRARRGGPGVRHPRLAPRDPPCRGRGHPDGLQETRSTRRPSCAPCASPRLRHGRPTRDGGGSPVPDRDVHPAETPSLSWRDNDQAQQRLVMPHQRILRARSNSIVSNNTCQQHTLRHRSWGRR